MKLLLARGLVLSWFRGGSMILCECGEVVDGDTFKDYIETSANPSTSTIGHLKCGIIFNFVDGKMPKRYSSKTELKSIAMRFAEKNKICYETIESLLIEVDRLKSSGNLSDGEILVTAFKNVVAKRSR